MLTNHSAQCLACENSVVNVSYHFIITILTQDIRKIFLSIEIRERKSVLECNTWRSACLSSFSGRIWKELIKDVLLLCGAVCSSHKYSRFSTIISSVFQD